VKLAEKGCFEPTEIYVEKPKNTGLEEFRTGCGTGLKPVK